MNKTALAAALPLLLAAPAFADAPAQPAPASAPAPWGDYEPLLGEWVADPTPADPGTGGFTLTAELGGRVLVRRNRADYPASKERPAQHHEDLTVFSLDGAARRADYWDNEGHVIRYAVSLAPGDKGGPTVTCTSEPAPDRPRFRFTYTFTAPGVMAVAFAIAPPGKPEVFKEYRSGTVRRRQSR